MNNKENKKNKIGYVLLIIAIFTVVIAIAVYLALHQNTKTAASDTTKESSSDEGDINTVTYNGKEYKLNNDIQTVLFLGIDKNAVVTGENNTTYSGQSDCIILMLMDKSTKKTTLLEVPRDTMTDIDLYTQDGEYFATDKEQITLQYAYGDGDKKSSWLMKKAVSTLLNNVPIDSTIALNMDGIVAITDALGGVEMTMTEDNTAIDPSYIQGAVVTLDGAAAEHFVRYRDLDATGSNMPRMQRQNQFIMTMISKVKQKGSEDSMFYTSLKSVADPYLTTDLSANDIQGLSSYNVNDAIEIVPGEMTAGAEHDEYYVDSEKLDELVIKLFYKEK